MVWKIGHLSVSPFSISLGFQQLSLASLWIDYFSRQAACTSLCKQVLGEPAAQREHVTRGVHLIVFALPVKFNYGSPVLELMDPKPGNVDFGLTLPVRSQGGKWAVERIKFLPNILL